MPLLPSYHPLLKNKNARSQVMVVLISCCCCGGGGSDGGDKRCLQIKIFERRCLNSKQKRFLVALLVYCNTLPMTSK